MIFYAFILNSKTNTNFYGRDPNLAALGASCDPNRHADAGRYPRVRAATQIAQNGWPNASIWVAALDMPLDARALCSLPRCSLVRSVGSKSCVPDSPALTAKIRELLFFFSFLFLFRFGHFITARGEFFPILVVSRLSPRQICS
jgi:hypothetical protein